MTEQRTIRYGIIGFGRHAERRFAPALRAMSNSMLVAIQKRNLAEARQKADVYEVPHAFESAEELAACPEVDAVLVCSPPSFHLAHVAAAARAGKHVLVEKPMACGAEEARRMISLAEEHHVLLGVGLCMRFCHSVRKAAEIACSGRLGTICFVEGGFAVDARLSTRKWLQNPAISGGGPVADLGSHMLDLMEMICNSRVTEVAAVLDRPFTTAQIEQQAAVSLKLSNGALGLLHVSFCGAPQKFLLVRGTEATLLLKNFTVVDEEVLLEIDEGGRIERVAVQNGNHFISMIGAFSESILKNVAPAVDGAAGLANQLLIDSIYHAGRVAQPVHPF